MMPLSPSPKNLARKSALLPVLLLLTLLLIASCTPLVSAQDVERDCRSQSSDFVSRVNCMVESYNSIPPSQRSRYEDLDMLFINQAVYLAQQVANNRITEQEAELELSKTRASIETQRRARTSYADRGRFGMGVGIGHGGSGYWGGYGW